MSVITAALRELMALGVTGDALVTAIERIEAAYLATVQVAPEKSKAALRTERWRERKANEASQNVTERHEASHCVTSDAPPLDPPSLPPRPPNSPPYNPPSHISGARIAKPNGFARFWEAYPSKTGKRAAEAAYVKAIGRIEGPDPPGTILDGVERAKAGRRWAEGFIPNPATWLNQDRWTDEELTQIRKSNDRPDHQSAKLVERQANLARAFSGAENAARARALDGNGLPLDCV